MGDNVVPTRRRSARHDDVPPLHTGRNNLEDRRRDALRVAMLPWGATEAHNYHLPYATDNIQSDQVAPRRGARMEAGARVVVLPTVPFGVNTTQLDIKLCLNMNPSTQAAVLADLVSALDRQGIHKLLIVNGHGGNDFRQMIRELQPKTRVFLSTINWWSCVDVKAVHRGAGRSRRRSGNERDDAPRAGARPPARPKPARAVRGRRALTPFVKVGVGAATLDAGDRRHRIGNPAKATAQKGAAYVEAAVERIAEFLVELAGPDLEDLYE